MRAPRLTLADEHPHPYLTRQVADVTLANGLRVNVIHDPQATRAAALIRLSAGSHHEPPEWPGLAHLLEHVLFAGSEDFQDEERLMAWAPAQGARLNATTRACDTAWFFEIAAAKLAAGLARLTDMLARPLLTAEATAAEAAAIEAEYRILCGHRATLCEAALSQAFAGPHPLHDFHVGNQASFAGDISALQQALTGYHQRFFTAGNLELWLSGPQSLDELRQLARHGEIFRAATAPPPETQPLSCGIHRAYALQLSGAEELRFSFLLPAASTPLFSLLQALLTDKAERSLLATLREAGIADDLQLQESYRSPQQSVLSVVVQLSDSRPEKRAAAEAIFLRWLERLKDLTAPQLTHYARLARQCFCQLSALDQLRELAFGFPPAGATSLSRWRQLTDPLRPENMSRLRISDEVEFRSEFRSDAVDEGETEAEVGSEAVTKSETEVTGSEARAVTSVETRAAAEIEPEAETVTRTAIERRAGIGAFEVQGFALKTAAIRWPEAQPAPRAEIDFYLPGVPLPEPVLPSAGRAALQAVPAAGEAVLMLNPAPGQRLSPHHAAIIEAALQPVIGQCQHRGGELNFSRQQGLWLLRIGGERSLLLPTLASVLEALRNPGSPAIAQGERRYRKAQQERFSDIAVRSLLAQLPDLLVNKSQSKESVGLLQKSSFCDVSPETSSDQPVCGISSKTPSEQPVCGISSKTPSERPVCGISSKTSSEQPVCGTFSTAATGEALYKSLSQIRWRAALYGGNAELRQALAQLLSQLPGETLSRSPTFVALAPAQRPFILPTESRDAATLLFCPLPDADLFADWQLLAALFEPHFFQQLRVEQQIGYVVSCRFHPCAGQAGLLFALQSPALSAKDLFRHTEQFIEHMAAVINKITAAEINSASDTLRSAFPSVFPQNPAQIIEHWQLEQLHGCPASAEVYRLLTPGRLQRACRRLIASRQHWWRLSNQSIT